MYSMPSRPNTTRPFNPPLPSERIRYNEVFRVCQCTAFEFSPRQCWCASSAAHRFCVGEIDEPVLRELRMQRNIHQSAIAIGSHLRHARDWLRIQRSVAENTQPSSPLRDQHSSIGKERDRPRMRQASRQNRDSNLVLLRRIQYERACAQRRNRNTDSRLLRVAQRNGRDYPKCGTSGVTYKHWLQPHNPQDFAGNDSTRGVLRCSHMTEYVAFLRGINAKRIVTFLDASAKTALKLPYHQDGASILRIKDGVAYS